MSRYTSASAANSVAGSTGRTNPRAHVCFSPMAWRGLRKIAVYRDFVRLHPSEGFSQLAAGLTATASNC